MPQDPKTLKIVNDSGNFTFTSDSDLYSTCSTLNFNSTGEFKIEGDQASLLRTTNGNANVEVNLSHLNLVSKKTNSNTSVFISAKESGGGITLDSNEGGTTVISTGNVDINSDGNDINLGVFPSDSTKQTSNIIMESSASITANTEDFQVIASDAINLISLTGDISIGSSVGSSVIKFENNNLLVNQTTSTLDRQLDVLIDDQASADPGYNGIVVNSSNTSVAPDITLQTNDSNASISLGIHPESSQYSYEREYIINQTSTSIIPIYGPEFTKADIGKTVYLATQDTTDVIASLGKTILDADNTYGTITLTTGGTYTGSESRIYRVEIDTIGSPDTFRWSRNSGNDYVETYKPITAGAISLEDGITITFSATTGNAVNDYWTFHTKITAVVGTSRTITDSEKMYIIRPFLGYISTGNASDIQIKTTGEERMRITGDGNIGIGVNNPSSSLEINNNVGKTIQVNDYDTNYQLNPFCAGLEYGGYVAVWESKAQDSDDYGVYLQQYMNNGTKYGTQSKVNVTVAGHQSHPHVAGRRTAQSRDFCVVWASEESDGSGVYDVYAHIYKGLNRLKTADIHITSGAATDQQLYPRVCGLTNGNYAIVWATEESSDVYNIQARIMDNNGNLGSVFTVNYTTTRSQNFPYPIGISADDSNIPGGLVVVFVNDYDTDASDYRYNIRFARFSISGLVASRYPNSSTDDTIVTTASFPSISDALVSGYHLYDGGFVISFYRNYIAKTGLYSTGQSVVGATSTITGSITAISDNVITVNGIGSGEYLVGEIVTINSQREELIDKVTHNSGLGVATITLSRSHKSIVFYKYGTDATASLSNKQINSNTIILDDERNALSNAQNFTRNNTIFNYRRPMSQIIELFNGDLVAVWTSGRIPSIYYRRINSTTGSLLDKERQIASSDAGLKQRNPSIAPLKTLGGYDGGMVVVWDSETLDTANTAIYQTIVNPNNNLVEAVSGDQLSKFSVTNEGYTGFGTLTPNSAVHVVTNNETDGNGVEIGIGNSDITLENTTARIQTTNGIANIKFVGKNFSELGIIQGGYSGNHHALFPQYDNLKAYYTFDEDRGSNSLTDQTINGFNGRLENFDVDIDWKDGFINNALEFNGSNNYVNLGINSALHDLAKGSGSGNDYTISAWVKIPQNMTTSSNLDIISNQGDLTAVGTYNFMIGDIGSNGGAYLASSITTTTGTHTCNGATAVTGDTWHFVCNVFHNSNTTLQTYLDGNLDVNVPVSGSVNSAPTANVYIGSRDASTSFFRGMIDELRIYNTALTPTELAKIRSYGSESKGKLVFSTQGGSNNQSDKAYGFIVDDYGSIQGAKIKGRPYERISGTTTFSDSSTSVTGTSTLFDKQLQVGDRLNFSSTNLTITDISSDTALTVNTTSSDTNSSNVIRKPAILTLLDQENVIQGNIDSDGNFMVGGSIAPTSRFELVGSGGSSDLPYLTLTNTTVEDTSGGRETRLLFRGSTSATSQHTLGYIEGSHDGTSSDTKGQLRIYLNNGTSVSEVLSIKNDGNVGIGTNVTPLGTVQINSESSSNCNVILSSGYDEEQIFGAANKFYFTGQNSITESNNLQKSALSMIQGSSDNTSQNVSGRIDFYTNNHTDSLGLRHRMAINSSGYIGLNMMNPQASVHLGANYNPDTTFFATSSGTTVTLTSGSVSDDNIIGGYIVFENSSLVTRKITARPGSTSLTIDSSLTVASATKCHIYYTGLVVSNSGNLSIGSNTNTSKLHVEGAISTAIVSKTENYNVTSRDSTILVDSSGGERTITLPDMSSIPGLKYVVKKIDSSGNNVIVATTNGNIDGASTSTLSTQYKFVEVQSDGSNWYIIGTNL